MQITNKTASLFSAIVRFVVDVGVAWGSLCVCGGGVGVWVGVHLLLTSALCCAVLYLFS